MRQYLKPETLQIGQEVTTDRHGENGQHVRTVVSVSTTGGKGLRGDKMPSGYAIRLSGANACETCGHCSTPPLNDIDGGYVVPVDAPPGDVQEWECPPELWAEMQDDDDE